MHSNVRQQSNILVILLIFNEQEAAGCKPVVLDTLPASVDRSIPATDTTPTTNHTPASFHPSTSTVYRLISVVEIIKREYLKVLETTRSTRLLGLHQYNEIGTLEDLHPVVASSNEIGDEKELEDVERTRHIIQAISGKHLLVLAVALHACYLLALNFILFLVHDEKKRPSCELHFRLVSYLNRRGS